MATAEHGCKHHATSRKECTAKRPTRSVASTTPSVVSIIAYASQSMVPCESDHVVPGRCTEQWLRRRKIHLPGRSIVLDVLMDQTSSNRNSDRPGARRKLQCRSVHHKCSRVVVTEHGDWARCLCEREHLVDGRFLFPAASVAPVWTRPHQPRFPSGDGLLFRHVAKYLAFAWPTRSTQTSSSGAVAAASRASGAISPTGSSPWR